ncbi:MAG: hypothetical protein WD768_09835 [Phycisphaeraceae bacterium]
MMTPRIATLSFALFLLAATLLTGCTTYVNIPGQTGDVASSNPNNKKIAIIEARALKMVIAESKPAKYVFALPAGTNAESYALVQEELGDLATSTPPGPVAPPPVEGAGGVPTLEVRQITVRGWYAQVDVVKPSDPANLAAPRQLVTAYLKYAPFDGWYAQEVRTWQFPVDEALQKSRAQGNEERRGPATTDGH